MTKNYSVTGEERKQMVQAISREIGIDPVYTRMPECAYLIGDIKVSKTGELIWDERTDDETIARIEAVLADAGFTAEEPEEPEAETDETVTDTDEDEEAEGLTFSFPRDGFTDLALSNLKNLIASKRTLIQKSLRADNLDLLVDEETVSFPWWDTLPTPEETAAYGAFLAALVKMAKEARRVTATERPTESEKYTFRGFLLRLGFIGAEHKSTRAVLLKSLTGHAAFKNQADADAFYERQKEKKAAAKVAKADEATETDTDAAEEEDTDDEISE